MAKLHALKDKDHGSAPEGEMMGYLPHRTLALNAGAASIDMPLHAQVPGKHGDHIHSDAIAASLHVRDLSTMEIINTAVARSDERSTVPTLCSSALDASACRDVAARLMPMIRGLISGDR